MEHKIRWADILEHEVNEDEKERTGIISLHLSLVENYSIKELIRKLAFYNIGAIDHTALRNEITIKIPMNCKLDLEGDSITIRG